MLFFLRVSRLSHNGDPIVMAPFSAEKRSGPPHRRASTTKHGPAEQSSPLSRSALSGCCTASRTKTHATCPQSRQSGAALTHTHARARLPWLPQTSTPRRQASFSIILQAGAFLGVGGRCLRLRNKKDVSWAPLLRRDAPPLATAALPRLLPAMPSWTRAPAPSAFPLVCAVDPDGGCEFPTKNRVMETQL